MADGDAESGAAPAEGPAPAPTPTSELTGPEADPAESENVRSGWATRIAWLIVGVVLISAGLKVIYLGDLTWVAIPVTVALTAVGIVLGISSWLGDDGVPPRTIEWLALGCTVAVIGITAWTALRTGPSYGTDELAFSEYAAHLLVHGHNPYVHSLAPAFNTFGMSPNLATYGLDGLAITRLAYPALIFLVYAPFIALGWTFEVGPWVDVIFWMVSVALVFVLAPRALRALVLILGTLPIMLSFAIYGVTDALYVPFLILAVYRWDRFPQARGVRAWGWPIAMGAAVSVKQTPWLAALIVVVALALEVRQSSGLRAGLGAAWRYLWRVVVVFAAINLPFIVADPRAWATDIMLPITSHTIPNGQGLVALTAVLGMGGGWLFTYTLLAAAVLVCVLVIFTLGYPRTKPVLLLFPAVVFFFASRSLGNYLIMLALPAVVAGGSIRVPIERPRPLKRALFGTRGRRLAVGISGLAVAVAAIACLAWPSPLEIQVTTTYSTAPAQAIDQVAVNVTNRAGQAVVPAFAVQTNSSIGIPWLVVAGPRSLGSGRSATYLLLAPTIGSRIAVDSAFRVVALTDSPAAISLSGVHRILSLGITLSPLAVVAPVHPGVPVVFVTQVVDDQTRPVHTAGLRVRLVAYSQRSVGLPHPGAASIDGHLAGARTVIAHTDAHGQARFTVVGLESSLNAVTLTAYLGPGLGNPTSVASNTASVIFYAGDLGVHG